MRYTMSKACGHPVIAAGLEGSLTRAECEAELCSRCAARVAEEMIGKTYQSEPGGPLFEVRAADEDFVTVEALCRAGGLYRWHSSSIIGRMSRVS
jgi:hypothetical protein